MPRRRADVLLPLEQRVLELALGAGHEEFHGFELAGRLDEGRQSLTAHGTLYKVLDRLERRGLLSSRWESDDEYTGGRPRRRLYRATAQTQPALAASREALARPAGSRLGLATS